MMRKIVYAITMVIIFTACNSTKKTTIADDGGWVNLFDGTTTNGWHSFKKTTTGKGWEVTDGTLHLNPAVKDGGDLTTDTDFDNFHLQLEWKIAAKGNSGIIFYVQDNSSYKTSWLTGPEMQVVDNDGHPDAKNPKHRAGDLYDLIAVNKENVKPAGEWNKAEIKSVQGKLDFFLNGELVVSTTMWDEEWNTLVAKSKFKNMADFAKFKSGKIALQDHGDEVWYRNIRIKKIPPIKAGF
jgi:hypothetical protein